MSGTICVTTHSMLSCQSRFFEIPVEASLRHLIWNPVISFCEKNPKFIVHPSSYNLFSRFPQRIFGCFVHFSAAFQGFLLISFCMELINALYTCRFLGCMVTCSISYEVADFSSCLFSSYNTYNLLQTTSYVANFSSQILLLQSSA